MSAPAFETLNRSGLSMLADFPLLTATARPLDTAIWSDCLICNRDVNACECDPDEYAAALLRRNV